VRRASYIADQLQFSFALETLALRYRKPASSVSATDVVIHLVDLIRTHRGRVLKRLMGVRDRLS
jgi:hypothetical protein